MKEFVMRIISESAKQENINLIIVLFEVFLIFLLNISLYEGKYEDKKLELELRLFCFLAIFGNILMASIEADYMNYFGAFMFLSTTITVMYSLKNPLKYSIKNQ